LLMFKGKHGLSSTGVAMWHHCINNAEPILPVLVEIDFVLGHFVCEGPEMLKPPGQNMLESCNIKFLCYREKSMLELHKSFENLSKS
jgi:hypothetical protein